MKADFIIVGVMKSGTTTLADYCTHHPSIGIPKKEIHFFDYDRNYSQGESWYSSHLEACRTGTTRILGEKTPYSFYRYTAERIYNYRQDIKLIWIFRNPVDRAYSNYNHDLYNVDEWRSFERCIDQENSRDILFQYLSKGRYVEQVEDYLAYFPADQMCFVLFEELLANTDKELKKVFNFLGVDADSFDYTMEVHSKKSMKPDNAALLYFYKKFVGNRGRLWNYLWRTNFNSSVKPKMNPATRQKLLEYYKHWNNLLSEQTGLDLSIWNK